MNEPPRCHDITIRIATEAGRHRDPAAFAVAAGRAAAAGNACILGAHAAGRSSAWSASPRPPGRKRPRSPWPLSPERSRPGMRCRHPAGRRVVPAVVRRLIEDRLPERVVAGIASDHHMPHAPAAVGCFPDRDADARLPAHPRLARPHLMTERAVPGLDLEQRSGHQHDHALTSCYASMTRSLHESGRVFRDEPALACRYGLTRNRAPVSWLAAPVRQILSAGPRVRAVVLDRQRTGVARLQVRVQALAVAAEARTVSGFGCVPVPVTIGSVAVGAEYPASS